MNICFGSLIHRDKRFLEVSQVANVITLLQLIKFILTVLKFHLNLLCQLIFFEGSLFNFIDFKILELHLSQMLLRHLLKILLILVFDHLNFLCKILLESLDLTVFGDEFQIKLGFERFLFVSMVRLQLLDILNFFVNLINQILGRFATCI